MIINGINNQLVELRIVNYEFPKNNSCEYDSNWLMIYLKVRSEFGNWETLDPSLLTWEVEEIINWFEKISNNENLNSNFLNFLEPNLEFELKSSENEKKIIRLFFDLESRPKSANDEKDYFVDFELTNQEISTLKTNLKRELEKYPRRII